MINSYVFPAPKPSYDLGTFSRTPGIQLVHMPRLHRDPATPHAEPFSFGLLVERPDGKPASHLLLYAHPNAVDVGIMAGDMEYYSRCLQMHVLAFEFRGYGVAAVEGSPGEEETNQDMEAAFVFATETLQFPPENIIFMGRSIGTGPVTLLASKLPKERSPALLVLVAPFTSIKACVREMVKQFAGSSMASFAGGIVADRFKNKDVIADVNCPILIVHGTEDEIVTFDQSIALVEAARQKKTDVEMQPMVSYGHNDLPDDDTIDAILRVLKKYYPQAVQASHWITYPPWMKVSSCGVALKKSAKAAVYGGSTSASSTGIPDLRYMFLNLDDDEPPATKTSLTVFVTQRHVVASLLCRNALIFISNTRLLWRDHLQRRGAAEKSSDNGQSFLSCPATFASACAEAWGSPFGVYFSTNGPLKEKGALLNTALFFGTSVPLGTSIGLPCDDNKLPLAEQLAKSHLVGMYYTLLDLEAMYGPVPSPRSLRRNRIRVPLKVFRFPPRLWRNFVRLLRQDEERNLSSKHTSFAPHEHRMIFGTYSPKFTDMVQVECERFMCSMSNEDWDMCTAGLLAPLEASGEMHSEVLQLLMLSCGWGMVSSEEQTSKVPDSVRSIFSRSVNGLPPVRLTELSKLHDEVKDDAAMPPDLMYSVITAAATFTGIDETGSEDATWETLHRSFEALKRSPSPTCDAPPSSSSKDPIEDAQVQVPSTSPQHATRASDRDCCVS